MRRALILLLLWVCAASASAQDNEIPREARAFVGLDTIYVFVEPIDSNVSNNVGFSQENITTDVELRLRGYNISVTNKLVSNPCRGILYVHPQLIRRGESSEWVFHVGVQLLRLAIVGCDTNSTFCLATVWEDAYTGLANKSEIEDQIRRKIIPDMIDSFCNLYLRYKDMATGGLPQVEGLLNW